MILRLVLEEIQLNEPDKQESASIVKKASSSRAWSVQSLAIEILSIIVGVMLALGLSEWNDERKHQAQAKVALQNIIVEVRSNIELLTYIHENNAATIAAMSGEKISGADTERSFIPGLQLRDTAWNTLLSTGLSNYVTYDTILLLSEMYSIQGIYKQTGVQLVEASMNVSAYSTVLETEVDNTRFSKQFIGYFEMLNTIEVGLLSSYEQAAEILEAQKY